MKTGKTIDSYSYTIADCGTMQVFGSLKGVEREICSIMDCGKMDHDAIHELILETLDDMGYHFIQDQDKEAAKDDELE